MTVLLVILIFAIFLLVDYFRTVNQPVAHPEPVRPKQPLYQPISAVVSGFQVPENLRYHPGHTWALGESPTLVRIGMDDFASKLVGKMEKISLPQRGQWVRQGQKIWTLFRDGKPVDMLSPVEGQVADINEAAVRDPERARKDPYAEGWLVTMQSPDAKTSFRNLLSGALARAWMEQAATQLRATIPSTIGALAQDGGIALDDATAHLPDEDWAALAKEFFLS
jgi:glycine cleavage system H lipoate-binding protein